MRTRKHLNATLGSIVVMVGTLWVPTARAEILVAQTRTSEAIYGGATYTVDFNGASAGGTSFSFETTEANTRVMFIFNAECAVDGSRTKWVGVDIMLDPAVGGEFAVSPSNGDNAFCSGDGTTTTGGGDFSLDGWVSATTVANALIATPGTHSVRVRVDGANSGLARLDDMSLTVIR
jgi:hypothetical protein